MNNGHSIQVRLMWRDPKSGQPQEEVHALPVTIGRRNSNTIMVDDRGVSRQHARLEQRGNQVVIIDQNSAAGVIVNGQKESEAALQDGGQFTLGPVQFTIKIEAADEEATSIDDARWGLRWHDPNTNQVKERFIDSSLSLGRDPSNDLPLNDNNISRHHARLQQKGPQLMLTDLKSANKTRLNSRAIPAEQEQPVKEGDQISIGDYSFTVVREGSALSAPPRHSAPPRRPARPRPSAPARAPAPPTPPPPPPPPPPPGVDQTISSDQTVIGFDEQDTVVFKRLSELQGPPLSFSEFNRPTVSVSELRRTGLQPIETTYLTIGGGLGSFVWVDHLQIFGVDPSEIMAVGLESKPHGRYERLCRNSQIPHRERLRSNSDSCPDNIWGWPGYAVREAWTSLIRGDIANALTVSTQIFIEPAFGWTYTPRAGDVFRSLEQEAKRINWSKIWRYGRVKAIRKTDDGRYAIAYTYTDQVRGRGEAIILAKYVHLAIGYPGVRFLPDLQRYREKTGDFRRVVNAYEQHDHVYQQLERLGGVVLVRGRGIVSSRVVQRIYEARQRNSNVSILHLMRRPLKGGGNKYRYAQRPTDNHWEFQPFNWPKAAWSGDLRKVLENETLEGRGELFRQWGGTTTADRPDWRAIVRDGLAEGWYRINFGNVNSVEQRNGRLVTTIRQTGDIQGTTELQTDFIIDGTGLESEIDKHPLLHDLLTHYKLQRNAQQRLHVANDFEIEGMRNGEGRMYAAGIITLGGSYAGVDSFLGLQYAALRIVDALVSHRAPGLRRLNGFRSFSQWLRWVRGVKP